MLRSFGHLTVVRNKRRGGKETRRLSSKCCSAAAPSGWRVVKCVLDLLPNDPTHRHVTDHMFPLVFQLLCLS